MDSKPVYFIVSFIVISVITLIVGVVFFGDAIFLKGSSRYAVVLFGLFGSASVSAAKPFGKTAACIVLVILLAVWLLFFPQDSVLMSSAFSAVYSAVFVLSVFLYLYLPQKYGTLRRTGFLLLGVSFSLSAAAASLLFFYAFSGTDFLMPSVILNSSSAFVTGIGIGLGNLLAEYIIGSYTSAMKEIK